MKSPAGLEFIDQTSRLASERLRICLSPSIHIMPGYSHFPLGSGGTEGSSPPQQGKEGIDLEARKDPER